MQINLGLTLDKLKESELKRINDRVGEKILARLPLWKQSNLTARAVELNAKAARTVLEQQELDAIQQEWDWVKTLRGASNDYYVRVQAAAGAPEIYTLMREYEATLTTY